MNDRFKFRVWDVRKAAYLNTDNVFIDADGVCYHFDTLCKRFDLMQYDVIVEQCTGLKDKNGNLIYEGDVVRTTANKIGVVKWIFNRCKFVVLLADDSMWLVHETQEIIGNIHEQEVSE